MADHSMHGGQQGGAVKAGPPTVPGGWEWSGAQGGGGGECRPNDFV
jgi:hypothetical protein